MKSIRWIAMLAGFGACAGGNWGDRPVTAAPDIPLIKTSGWARTHGGSRASVGIGGNPTDCNWFTGAGTTKFDGPDVQMVKSFIYCVRANHGTFDNFYHKNLGIVNAPGQGMEDLKAEVVDTSGDGNVSAYFNTACGINVAIASYYTGIVGWSTAQQSAAAWQDIPTCPKGPSNIYKGFNMGGYGVYTYPLQFGDATFTNNAPGETQVAFSNMPLEYQQDLLNSLNPEVNVADIEGMGEAYRLPITRLEIGGRSYEPREAYIYATRSLDAWAFDFRQPGMRLLAWWAAAQLEQALNRGLDDIRWTVTINDAITLVSDNTAQGFVWSMPPSRSLVTGLRHLATQRAR